MSNLLLRTRTWLPVKNKAIAIGPSLSLRRVWYSGETFRRDRSLNEWFRKSRTIRIRWRVSRISQCYSHVTLWPEGVVMTLPVLLLKALAIPVTSWSVSRPSDKSLRTSTSERPMKYRISYSRCYSDPLFYISAACKSPVSTSLNWPGGLDRRKCCAIASFSSLDVWENGM